MGTGSSILCKNKTSDSSKLPTVNRNNTNNNLFDVNGKRSPVKDVGDSLLQLPKNLLAVKIISFQNQLNTSDKPVVEENNNAAAQANKSLIPRSLFTNLDLMGSETLKAKDVLIAQLQRELKAQKKIFENERLELKKKIENYAAEITELRFQSNGKIANLENELRIYNQTGHLGSITNKEINIEKTSPLILKLSQKLNEQADVIKQLELSICRKDEIIEGFKLFEANQYENLSRKASKEQDNPQQNLHISSNTHSFVSKELMFLASNRKLKSLSFSDESWFSEEALTPSKDTSFVEKRSEVNKHSSVNSSIGEVSKPLVGLPTNVILDSPRLTSSPNFNYSSSN